MRYVRECVYCGRLDADWYPACRTCRPELLAAVGAGQPWALELLRLHRAERRAAVDHPSVHVGDAVGLLDRGRLVSGRSGVGSWPETCLAAWMLRQAGWAWAAIAESLHISSDNARKAGFSGRVAVERGDQVPEADYLSARYGATLAELAQERQA